MLSHPNIAQVYDGGTANGHLFIAMEYVDGSAFTAACDEQKLSLRDRIRLFAQVCEAIQHAHQRGVIHRDLKPSNVLVTRSGERAIPKVIDFGIAKGVGVRLSAESIQTRAGTLLGTPEYMSPEQAMSGDIDTRSDVYALATMLYELVCGVLPFEFGEVDLMHALWMVAHEDPASTSARFAGLSKAQKEQVATLRATTADDLERSLRGEIDWIVMKAIEKDPAARYVSAGELAADLGRFLADHPVLAGPPSGTYRLKKYMRRHRAGAAAVVSVAAALVVGILGTSWMAAVASRERDAAQIASANARKEAAVSKATADFVKGMLASPDPSAAGSRDVRVVEVLERASRELEGTMAKEPEVAAAFRHTLGQSYHSLGLFDQAKPLLERAWEDRKKILGPEDPATLAAQHDLAVANRRLGNTEESGKLIRAAYLTRRRVLGENHVDTLASLDEMGVHHMRRGEMERSEALFRQAINGFQRAAGPDDRRTLASMNNLAQILGNRGGNKEAEAISREVLARRRRTLGESHPDTINAMNNLATTVFMGGGFDEAIVLTRAGIAGNTAILGPDHIRTLTARNNLAAYLVRAKRFDEAIEEFTDIQAVYARTLGSEHERALIARNNIAGTMSKAGRPKEAAEIYRGLLRLPIAYLRRRTVTSLRSRWGTR